MNKWSLKSRTGWVPRYAQARWTWGGIYFAEKKLLRPGASPGGGENLVAYLEKEMKRGHLPNYIILCEDGGRQGGA